MNMNAIVGYVEGEHGTSKDLILEGWDWHDTLGLIAWKCGFGKSRLAVYELLNAINKAILNKVIPATANGLISPHEVLICVSRSQIKRQMLKKYGDRLVEVTRDNRNLLESLAFGEVTEPDKIRITTYHAFGSWLSDGFKPSGVRLFIGDEIHSLFTDTFVFQILPSVRRWLSDSTDVVRVGLTATPEPLLYLKDEFTKYGNRCEFGFRLIAKETKPKYRAEHVTVVAGTTPRILLRECQGKTFALVYSAKEAYEIASEREDAMFIVSEGSDQADDEGRPIAELMDKEKIAYLLEYGLFPNGINVVVCTSAFREGVDLNENVDNVIVQAYQPHEIIQALGRPRNDIPNVYCCLVHDSKTINEKMESAQQTIRKYEEESSAEQRQKILAEQYRADKANEAARKRGETYDKSTPYFVYRYGGTYAIDWSVLCMWEYRYNCYLTATNYSGNKMSLFGVWLPIRRDFYKEIFSDYTDDLKFSTWDNSTDTTNSLIKSRKSLIPSIVKPYIGVKIRKGDSAESDLLKKIKPIDKEGRATREKRPRRTILWQWIKETCEVEHRKDSSWFYRITATSKSG